MHCWKGGFSLCEQLSYTEEIGRCSVLLHELNIYMRCVEQLKDEPVHQFVTLEFFKVWNYQW